jgi:phosphate-selective porin
MLWKKSSQLLIFVLIILQAASLLTAGQEDPQKKEPALKWSGYGQVQYDYPEGGVDGFRIRRARMSLTWSSLKNLSGKLQIETLMEPTLLDFHLDWKFNRNLALRVGQFKVPFSRENLQSSADLDTVNRSQTVERLCPGRENKAKGRDIGAALTGSLANFQYALALFNGSGINRRDGDSRKDIAARLVFSPSQGFSAGVSHYRGQAENLPGADKIRTGLEAAYSLQSLFIKGEAIFGRDGGIDRLGWYLLAGMDVLKDKLRIVARYDALDMDRDLDGRLVDTLTLGAVWMLAKRTKILLNYEIRNDRPADVKDGLFLLQFQASF